MPDVKATTQSSRLCRLRRRCRQLWRRVTRSPLEIILVLLLLPSLALSLLLLVLSSLQNGPCDINIPLFGLVGRLATPLRPSSCAKDINKGPKKNVILMISDGFGPASMTLARTLLMRAANASNTEPLARLVRERFPQLLNHAEPESTTTPLDALLVGTSRTRSSSSYVTDSAAGATAFSCNLKTYNGGIAVSPDGLPCATFFEAAARRNYKTGLVVKSSVTDATPASFNSHALFRSMEDEIALQQIGYNALGRTTDLLLGGGLAHFTPRPANSSKPGRADGRDLLIEAREKFDFQVVTTREQLLAPGLGLARPLLGLFARGGLPYEIDRPPHATSIPTLPEMAGTALRLLSKFSESRDVPGYFLMIEGSFIDVAAHKNDPATSALEAIEYLATVHIVKQYVAENPGTILVSTSDHETGGMSLGKQSGPQYPIYEWKPDALLNQTVSVDTVATEIAKLGDNVAKIHETVRVGLGVQDLKEDEISTIVACKGASTCLEYFLGEVASKRAVIGWATHGHSAVDVNVYANCNEEDSCRKLKGNMENTQVGRFLAKYLKVSKDLPDLTKILNGGMDLQGTFAAFKKTDEKRHKSRIQLQDPHEPEYPLFP